MRVEVLSRKQIVDDFSHGIRRRLTHIRCARCGNGALNPSLPEHGSIVNAYELEIGYDPDKLLRFHFPPADLTDESQSREFSLAGDAHRRVGVRGKCRKACVLFFRQRNPKSSL